MLTLSRSRHAASTLLIGLAFVTKVAVGSADAASPYPTPAQLPLWGEQPRVAIGDGGQLAAVWMHGFRNGTRNGPGGPYNNEIAAATGLAFGDLWLAPTVISVPGFSVLPQVGVDNRGDAAAIWQNFYPQEGAIDASYRQVDFGIWQGPVAISAPGERGTDVQIVLEPNGDAVAVWDKLGEGPGAGLVATETGAAIGRHRRVAGSA